MPWYVKVARTIVHPLSNCSVKKLRLNSFCKISLAESPLPRVNHHLYGSIGRLLILAKLCVYFSLEPVEVRSGNNVNLLELTWFWGLAGSEDVVKSSYFFRKVNDCWAGSSSRYPFQ